MAQVEIYRLQNDGTQKVIVTCRLVDKTSVCEGDEKLVTHLTKEGIRDYSVNPPVQIFPTEGEKFLEQLKNNFTSGYLNASDIKE